MDKFGCCRLKPVPSYYVCKTCSKIFHKSCVQRDKHKYRFLGGYQITCCNLEEQIESEIDQDSILEKTISDLSEDSEAKSKHIQKLKAENEVIIEEAQRTEEELNNILLLHKKTLEEKDYMEQNYIRIAREQEEYVRRLSDENSEATGLNTTLNNDIKKLKECMEKLENDFKYLHDLKNSMTSIEVLLEENLMLRKEMDDNSVKQHRDEMAADIETDRKNSHKHSKSITSTGKNSKKHLKSVTPTKCTGSNKSSEISVHRIAQSNQSVQTNVHKIKKQILLLGDTLKDHKNHGRDHGHAI
ncbi:unnamed protein product [Ceutorhynchus assimilis]|uniref:Uncharacterized protein n=1 Tax=Ceutorhynchus assimilis TaxID=467358 RepID=A0A9N9MKG4_9CUCU|nr:unnamed protein product [Ceutorhynchus assimilis]